VVGAVRELAGYWHVRTGIAVQAERRRLARELHDGVVQELGWIRGQAVRSPDAAPIAAAAERALFEARRAISALVSVSDEPLAPQVERAAREAASLVDVTLGVELSLPSDPDPESDADTDPGSGRHDADLREALVRIVREAVLNAGRHSGADEPVLVRLAPGHLTVTDTGCGFDPARDTGGGFGLVGMADRAEAVGARVQIRSRPGAGTTVEVTW